MNAHQKKKCTGIVQKRSFSTVFISDWEGGTSHVWSRSVIFSHLWLRISHLAPFVYVASGFFPDCNRISYAPVKFGKETVKKW
ncbi:MAG: hypothetical protein ACXWKG_19635 [Limisphaerales bacterium]